MLSSDTVLGRLRSATHEAHRQLETQLDVMRRLQCDAERKHLIIGYRTLYSSAAALLAPWLDGADGQPGPEMAPVELLSRAEALGFQYVIEGSALGGRMILRDLEALGIDTTELGFLNPHGARMGAMWRSFTDLLERELSATPAVLDEAVAGALKGFAYARLCLGVERPGA